MDAIRNTWIEKERKKAVKHTAPSYEREVLADKFPFSDGKHAKRHTTYLTASLVKTLRGIRK